MAERMIHQIKIKSNENQLIYNEALEVIINADILKLLDAFLDSKS